MKALDNKTNGLLNFSDFSKWRYKALYLAMFLFILLISLCALLPIVWVFLSGFKSTEEMYRIPPTLFPSKIEFSAVVNVWDRINFGSAYLNSLCLILGCLTFDICFNGMLGYVLSRVKPSGSRVIDTLVFWSMLLPGISMVPLYMTFVDMPVFHINLSGNYFPLWLMAGCNAFNVLLFRSFFNGIPMSYMEAAWMDGASNLRIFFSIILPLSVPIIAVVTIFSVTTTWSNFMWPYLLLGSTPYEPVSVKLYQLSSSGKLQDNELMLATMFSIIPPVIFYSFFSKKIMGGLNMSGIKG